MDTVLIVDDFDNPATPAVGDGDTVVAINETAYFGAGKTAEATGTSEIEFLVDPRAGTDQLSLGGNNKQTWWWAARGPRGTATGTPIWPACPSTTQLYGAGGQDYLSGQGGSGAGTR